MKQIVIAAMVMMTMASGAQADGKSFIRDWDYFWGTTLNPANTGWNDFWNQCHDPNKTSVDCMYTVAVGTGIVIATGIIGATVVAVSAIAATPSK